MRVDFQKKKVMFLCRSRSAEFQMTSFLAKAEQRKFKSQIVLCANAELLNFENKY